MVYVIVVDLRATSLSNAHENVDVHHASMDLRSVSLSRRRLPIKVYYFFAAVTIVVFGAELSKKNQAVNPLAVGLSQLTMRRTKELMICHTCSSFAFALTMNLQVSMNVTICKAKCRAK